MVNEHNQIVCDETGIILNDGVTLFPGYVEIKYGLLTRFDSRDPMNELAKQRPYVLHNRVEYIYPAQQEACDDERLEGKHFLSKVAMHRHLTKK